MSEAHVEAVQARYAEFARGDFTRLMDLPDNYEFVASADLPDAGNYTGEDARRWIRAWVESFDGLTIEATELIDAGDRVLAAITQRGRPRGSLTMVEGRWYTVDTFRDGESIRTEAFAERAEALEAAGLPPA